MKGLRGFGPPLVLEDFGFQVPGLNLHCLAAGDSEPSRRAGLRASLGWMSLPEAANFLVIPFREL